MQVNDKQKQISKLLWDFQSLREEHVYKLCNCEEKDINFLIANKEKEKDDKEKNENEEEKNKDNSTVEIQCTNEDIFNNQCNGTMTNEQAEILHDYLKSALQNGTYNNEGIMIQTKNADYQIDTSSNQKMISSNKTSIDLGLCENITKEKG